MPRMISSPGSRAAPRGRSGATGKKQRRRARRAALSAAPRTAAGRSTQKRVRTRTSSPTSRSRSSLVRVSKSAASSRQRRFGTMQKDQHRARAAARSTTARREILKKVGVRTGAVGKKAGLQAVGSRRAVGRGATGSKAGAKRSMIQSAINKTAMAGMGAVTGGAMGRAGLATRRRKGTGMRSRAGSAFGRSYR